MHWKIPCHFGQVTRLSSVKFGTGSTQHMIHINSICEAIGQSVSQGMPFFHALTGCDTTSAFRNKDRKTGWNTWSGYQAITSVFEFLSQNPFSTIHPQLPDFDLLQKFVIRLYSKSIEATYVNNGRKLLFRLNQNLKKDSSYGRCIVSACTTSHISNRFV